METAVKMIPDEFGHKIGGSRRDMWASGMLTAFDLATMNSEEQNKYCRKRYIWPTPDFKKMHESGISKEVLFFMKMIRDAVRVKPISMRTEYVCEVGAIRDEVMSYTTWNQCQSFLQKFIKDGGRLKDPKRMVAFSAAGGHKIHNVAIKAQYRAWFEREVLKKKFLQSSYETFIQRYRIVSKNGKELVEMDGRPYIKGHGSTVLARGLSRERFYKSPEDTLFLLQGGDFIVSGTKAEIDDILHKFYEANQTALAAKPAKKRKKKFVPVKLLRCRRTEYGFDIADSEITPDELLNKFGFYGGEFGNWLNDATRQKNLNLAHGAFEDLAAALGIQPKNVSINGHLSIAFGARGRGNAAAHYEPARKVINLTKLSGAGSLAHEYGHALDDIVSKLDGNSGAYTESPGRFPAMERVIETMRYKRINNRSDRRIDTEFYKNSKCFDDMYSKEDKGYWSSNTEMFARAFSCYVMDKLKAMGLVNDYLCCQSESAVSIDLKTDKTIRAYPEGEERVAINEAIDDLIEAIRRKHSFKH